MYSFLMLPLFPGKPFPQVSHLPPQAEQLSKLLPALPPHGISTTVLVCIFSSVLKRSSANQKIQKSKDESTGLESF